MLTKIELTDADVARSESLKVSHALELAKNGQFWMLLLFYPVRHADLSTYDQRFAPVLLATVPDAGGRQPLVRDPRVYSGLRWKPCSSA
ncbi:hypothetical protein LNQ03_05550 [Klebsiella pneumoniae subsp. pneumoniae]|nr:hypothetical protein [Klebsiella pneumoniae subsp. pneumoniae]